MLKIDKIKPNFFDNLIKNKKTWDDLNNRDVVNDTLLKEQEAMCAYCEIKLNKYHIDHFYKRNLFPELTFDYNNLFLSCNSEKHSAKYKDKLGLQKNEFVEFYSPIDINNQEFEYSLLGEIVGKTTRARKTIEVFNLNHKSLVERRSKIIKQINSCKDYLQYDLFEFFKEFKTLLLFIQDYYARAKND